MTIVTMGTTDITDQREWQLYAALAVATAVQYYCSAHDK